MRGTLLLGTNRKLYKGCFLPRSNNKVVKMDELNELYGEAKDAEILKEMKKRKKKKSFDELINQKKINSFELDKAMTET